ncbi:DUF7322 domain-containing protein [Haloplanus sp.]|uniref:DUF7322 domain-containing protein n=1 Tax=Haloplanus sp. TaxID=1961696 RepID=UPI00261CC515|nr:hypothetical protein [Haloplanus sp.]
MPSDPWPEEPKQPEPESRWGNPEDDLPRVPTPDTDETDVDPEVLETFWRSVLLANVAVLGVALGPMLVYFRGQWRFGLAAVAVGAIAGLRVYQHYRAFTSRHAGDTASDGPEDTDDMTDERNV